MGNHALVHVFLPDWRILVSKILISDAKPFWKSKSQFILVLLAPFPPENANIRCPTLPHPCLSKKLFRRFFQVVNLNVILMERYRGHFSIIKFNKYCARYMLIPSSNIHNYFIEYLKNQANTGHVGGTFS